VRYIEERLDILNQAARLLNTPVENLVQKIGDLKEQVSQLQRELHRLRQQMLSRQAGELAASARDVAGVRVLATRVDAAGVDEMRRLADDLRNQLGSGVVILGAVINGKPMLIAAATPDVVEQGVHAGNIVKALAPIIGGGGGGRPNMAQAGGRDATRLDQALDAAYQIVASQLEK
jgi:alanyl-tRNA synthetase